MSRIVLVKGDSNNDAFYTSVVDRYNNNPKIWFLPNRDSRQDYMKGLMIYTHPWSVDKFMYATLSYLVYMWNPEGGVVICTDNWLDIVLLASMKNAVIFFLDKEYRKLDTMAENFNYIQLKTVQTEMGDMPKYKQKQYGVGLFPRHDDNEMISWWNSDRVINAASSILKEFGGRDGSE